MSDVLCVAYSCPPILDAQSILLAKMLGPLRERGYRFRIVGLDPRSCLGKTDPWLEAFFPSDTHVVRIPASEKRLWFRALNRWLPSLLSVPDKHLPVHMRAVRAGKALFAATDPNILFSWAQYHSCSLVALRLKKSLGLPWVAHFSDPWHGNPYRRPRPFARWINARLEEMVITHADAVVFVNEETRDFTMARYPRSERDKAHVIPHCFDPGLYPSSRASHAGMVFRHVGYFYGERGPGSLLAAIARLRDRQAGLLEDVRFELVGRIRASEQAQVRSLGLDGLVQLRDGVGYRDSLREMKEADVLLLIEAPGDSSLFLPSKVVDYVGAGPPVLALSSSGGPAARLLRGGGDAVVTPDDVDGIAAALARYIEQFKRGELDRLRRAREAVAGLECRATMGMLADIFDRVKQRRCSQHASAS